MKKLLLSIVLMVAAANGFGATYTWKGGASGEWSTSTNWNPERATPATDDILVFDLGNRDGASTAGDVNVSNISNETIGQLQIVRATGTSTGFKTLTMSGVATTLTISGDLVIGYYANGTNCRLTDGGNTIIVRGNFTTVNQHTASSTYHTTSSTGKIVFTNSAATLASGAGSGNINFQNVEIGDGINPSNLTQGGAFQINGNLHINSNATLSNNNKSFILNSTNGTGGTISGSGTIIATSTSGTFYIQGTAGAEQQTVGTINFNTSTAANSSINSLQLKRPNSTVTIGTANSNTLTVVGTITLDAGTINDGGNAIVVKGSTIFAVTATPGAGVHTGSGKIVASRSNAGPVLVTAGKTVSVGNLEIGSTSGAVTYAVGSGTNLTINGTLTLSKPGSVINASGSNITFQNADVPIALTAGTITTDANTTINFGSTGNKDGAAFTIPNDLFTSAPTVGTINITRNNPLTFNNQAVNATTINVNAGSKLSLGADITTSNINLKSEPTIGTATIVDNGYTVTATNTAVEQHLSYSRNWYISSPVTGATATAGTSYWSYTEAGNNGLTWTPLSSGFTYTVGKGYVLRPTGASTYTFEGALNTGDKTISDLTSTASAKIGYNLVGNPYPSYVKWSEVVRTNVGETMWYRTHDDTDYQFYTYHPVDGSGGIGVPESVTDYIPPMQAFWVKVDATKTGSIEFLNEKRYHRDVTGNNFRAPAQQSSTRSIVRLQLNKNELKDETVVYLHQNASDSFDRYDSEKMFNSNSNAPAIYTESDNTKLVINGLSTSGTQKRLPLGINAVPGTYSLTASELKLTDADASLSLIDKRSGKETLLQEGESLSITIDEPISGSSTFELLYRAPAITTTVPENELSGLRIFSNEAGRIMVMNAPEGSSVQVTNLSGQKIHAESIRNNQQQLQGLFGSGAYLIQVMTEGKTNTSKLIM